jgi:lysophospholipase L1-like esterase
MNRQPEQAAMAAWSCRLWVLALAFWWSSAGPAAQGAPWRVGVGVLGDSYSDEYQFYPPDRSQARNWVEILAEARGLDFGPLSLASRGTPRHQGYAYNWAASGATTDDLIAEGQHTGLAAQVKDGSVGLVLLFIGGNDFIQALQSDDPPRAAATALPHAVRNVRTAMATIRDAHPEVKVVLATVPDISELPEFAEPLQAGTLSRSHWRAVDAAICQFNQALRDMAEATPNVAVVDLYWSTRVARMLSPQHVLVGGVRVRRTGTGNDIDHMFLADRRHIGTVAQGLIARMFMETLNRRFDAGLEPLSDQEILRIASQSRHVNPALAGAGDPVESRPSP